MEKEGTRMLFSSFSPGKHGPRVGSWYHKGPFYMPVSTVSCLESEKTRASNAFHYAIAWGCQLVKGLDLVGWSGRCAN